MTRGVKVYHDNASDGSAMLPNQCSSASNAIIYKLVRDEWWKHMEMEHGFPSPKYSTTRNWNWYIDEKLSWMMIQIIELQYLDKQFQVLDFTTALKIIPNT